MKSQRAKEEYQYQYKVNRKMALEITKQLTNVKLH